MTSKRWIAIGCVAGFLGTAWQAQAVVTSIVPERAAERLSDSTVQIQLQDGFHRPLPGETSLQLPAASTPIDPALRQAVLNAYVVQQGDVLAMLNVPQKPGEYIVLLGCYEHGKAVPYFTMQLFWAHGRYDKKRWIHLQSREISEWDRRYIWNAERAKHDAAQGEGHSTESPPLPLRSLQAVVDVRAGFLDLDSDGTAELVLRLRYPTSGVSDRTIGEVYSFPGLERRLSLPLQVRYQLDKNPVVEEAVLRREDQPASMLLRVLSYQSDACKSASCSASVSDGWVRYAWGGPAAVRAVRLQKQDTEDILGWSGPAVDVTGLIGQTGATKPNKRSYTRRSDDGKTAPVPPASWVQQAADQRAGFRLFSAAFAGFRPVDFVRRHKPPADTKLTPSKRRVSKNIMTREDIAVHDAYDLLVPLAPQDLRLRELVVYQPVDSQQWTWSREGRELSLPIPAGWQVVPEDLSGGTVREVTTEFLWISVPLRQANSSARSTHVYVVDQRTYRLLWQHRLSSEATASGPACTGRAFHIDMAKRGHQLFEWEETCGNQRQSTWWVQKDYGAPFQEVPQPSLDPVPLEELRVDSMWPGDRL